MRIAVEPASRVEYSSGDSEADSDARKMYVLYLDSLSLNDIVTTCVSSPFMVFYGIVGLK